MKVNDAIMVNAYSGRWVLRRVVLIGPDGLPFIEDGGHFVLCSSYITVGGFVARRPWWRLWGLLGYSYDFVPLKGGDDE